MILIKDEWRYFDEALGIPYPWYTSQALKFIDAQDIKGMRIWEYGVGDSTAWYRARGATVEGVDNDLEWATKMGCNFAMYSNEYVGNMVIGKMYDLIAVDGVWRDECVIKGWEHLKNGGILVVDNYKQPSVPQSWEKTEKLLEGKNFVIHKEPEHADWQTLIILK